MDFDFAEVLRRMVEVRASDIHLTSGFPPAMRDKGHIVPMEGFPQLSDQDTREVVYSILNDDQRKRFENNQQLDFAYAIPGVARFRVNCFFQRGSVSAAFRLVPQEIPALDSLGVPQVLRDLAAKPRGFVLVTGPDRLGQVDDPGGDDRRDQREPRRPHHDDRGPDRIRPPAQALDHQPARGRLRHHDFALALRAALRQDPDVILVGEMRDLETIATAMTAAETGHLVFATLHTQRRDADDRPHHRRLPRRAAGPDPHAARRSPAGDRHAAAAAAADGKGRVVACEVLLATPAIRNLIREGKTHQIYAAVQTSGAVGMQTMDADLARLVRAGKITRSVAEQRPPCPRS